MLFFGRKSKKSQSKDAATSPAQRALDPQPEYYEPAPSQVQIDAEWPQISIDQGDDLVDVAGNPIKGRFESGEYVAGPKQGGRSRALLAAGEGQTWRLMTTLRVVQAAPNVEGQEAKVLAGPLFFDAQGKVIYWWRLHPCVSSQLDVEVTAPAGTTHVAAGIHGAWAKDKEPPPATVAFSHTKLVRVS